MNLFYSARIEGKSAFLTDEEHRHCTKVLRYTTGAEVVCTDGKGRKFQTKIHHISKKETELHIDYEELIAKSAHHLHIAIGMPKSSNRLDFLIEKLVEIGDQEMTPLLTAHSERKKMNTERYRKKINSASTQSLKYHFPILHEPVTFTHFLQSQVQENMLVAHYSPENESLLSQAENKTELIVLIGPEGDFSKTELIQISESGIQTVNLSQHRLRTETAAIVACALVNEAFSK